MRFAFRRSRQEPSPAEPVRPTPAEGGASYVSRQPVFTMQSKLFGYDLAFRSPPTAGGEGPSAASEALRLADALLVVGLDVLANQRRAFVTLSLDALMQGVATLLPPDRAIIGVSADVAGSEGALKACQDLKARGFALAVRDCVLAEGMSPFVPLADYVSLDGESLVRMEVRDAIHQRLAGRRPVFMATAVDTQECHRQVRNAGIDLYQGACFGRVDAQSTKGMSPQQMACLQLLQALNDPNLSMNTLEDIIKRDTMLSFRLLRAVGAAGTTGPANAPAVNSIRLALVLLGQETVRRWASLWAVNALADSQDAAQAELVTASVARARCCELLDTSRETDGFLLGLCSLLDVLLGQPLGELLKQLPLSGPTREALSGGSNARRDLLECVVAYERGQWEVCEQAGRRAGVDLAQLPAIYKDAYAWASSQGGR